MLCPSNGELTSVFTKKKTNYNSRAHFVEWGGMNVCKDWATLRGPAENCHKIHLIQLYLLAMHALRRATHSHSPSLSQLCFQKLWLPSPSALHASRCVSKSVLLFLGHMWFQLLQTACLSNTKYRNIMHAS